ncbi:hypothetical protein GCM10028818_40990 [Spirosoma horti]
MLTRIISPSLTVVLYDSIKDLPASAYQLARQYEVISAELGQNEAEQIAMLTQAENFAMTGKLAEFSEQMANYRLARALTKQNFQAGQLDWACRLHSVNGVVMTDYSEDSLVAKIEEWSKLGLTQQLIEDLLDDVKKKSLMN